MKRQLREKSVLHRNTAKWSTTSGTGSERISSQGLFSSWSKLSRRKYRLPESITSSRLVDPGSPRMGFLMITVGLYNLLFLYLLRDCAASSGWWRWTKASAFNVNISTSSGTISSSALFVISAPSSERGRFLGALSIELVLTSSSTKKNICQISWLA